MALKTVPDPVLLTVLPAAKPPPSPLAQPLQGRIIELRETRIEEFLQARSLSPNSQLAYRRDLNHFLRWITMGWAAVTPRQVAQFKAHLLRIDSETDRRVLVDSSVCRILGTLKNFYGWLLKSQYVSADPTIGIELPKLVEPEAQNLDDITVEQILQAATNSSIPERNITIVSVLLHGLRASEVVNLNLEDYDGQRLNIRQAKADSKGKVPLTVQTRSLLDRYLEWRERQGHSIEPNSPIFISESNRNRGQRLSYDGIYKVVKEFEAVTNVSIHPHQFRHTFATNMMVQGMNPYHVMTMTRHRSTASFRRYTKAADQAAAEAAFYHMIESHNTKSI
ncbi:tyrosine-type recombinase/integrase [Chamaesiphon sp.]|uniref:tyrosine-type recombinase/integrase n=1 Tax=Chamaesiphon sp. TaxID=2814140 RepID=UPI003593B2CC